MVEQRIVVLRGEHPLVDVNVAPSTALSFVLACHDNFPGASIYVEGALLDPAELDEAFRQCSTAAVSNGPTAPMAAPAAAPAPPPPPGSPPMSLSDFKEASGLVGTSLERTLNFQIATVATLSETIRKHLDTLLSHDHRFAEECARQRQQHRQALQEIEVFDRGTKVATMAEEALLRNGHRRRPEGDGLTRGDLIEGFSKLA